MHKYVGRKLTVDNDDIYIYIHTMNRYKNQRQFQRVRIYRFGEIMAVRKRWNDYWQSHGDILKSTRWKFNTKRGWKQSPLNGGLGISQSVRCMRGIQKRFRYGKGGKEKNGVGARYENLKQLLQSRLQQRIAFVMMVHVRPRSSGSFVRI